MHVLYPFFLSKIRDMQFDNLQTLKETSEATIIAMDLIKHYFPGSSIYPVLGLLRIKLLF